MSVAFRRESDEEHKEPRFELPLPPGPNLVTPRGLALIDARIAALDAAIAGERDADAIAALRRERRYWNTRRATAVVAPAAAGDEVAFGARVTFRLNGAVRTIAIVGSDEADPASGYVAFTAPLARAMIGARAGERLDFNGAVDALEIVAVAPPADEQPV